MTKNLSELDVLGYLRFALIAAIAITGYLLLLRWQADYVNVETHTADSVSALHQNYDGSKINEVDTTSIVGSSGLTISSEQTDTSNNAEPLPFAHVSEEPVKRKVVSKTITVKTDVLTAEILLEGGDLHAVSLLDYPEQLESAKGFELLSDKDRHFVVQSEIFSSPMLKKIPDLSHIPRPVYTINSGQQLELGQEQALLVPLVFENEKFQVVKTYSFERGSYQPKIMMYITNKSDKDWSGFFYGRIVRDNSADPSAGTGGFGLPTFNGAAYWTPEKRYNKLDFDEITEGFQTSHQGGWISWVQHYFLTALVLDGTQDYIIRAEQLKDSEGDLLPRYSISFNEAIPTLIPAGQTERFEAQIYVGPKIEKELAAVSEGLNLAVDYGFLFMISKLLFQLLSFIFGFVGNWGVAIILLTVFVKALFLYPSAISYRSMARMRKLQPEMSRLKEQYGDDRQKMSQEVMKLYKKEKVNPFGGCLPVLLQMPVFFALYWTLLESVELRQAPFFAWIQDLSAMDPYFILPLMMGVSMYVQTSLNPVPPDPTQAKVMKFMPVMFTVFFLFFPAGLVLYWLTNNVLSIAQQWYITKKIEA